jgi:hypothetical protein
MNQNNKALLYFFSLFVLVFTSSKIIAQQKINPEHAYVPEDSLPEYNFSLLRNNPDSVSKFTISLYPMCLTQYNASAEIQVTYDLTRRFTLDGHIAIVYLNQRDEYDYGPKVVKTDHDYNLNFTWNVFSQKNPSRIHTGLLRIKNKPPGTAINLGFEGTVVNKVGLRFGVSSINESIRCSQFGNSQVDFIGYDKNDPLKTKIDLSRDQQYTTYKWHISDMASYYTYMAVSSVNIGFQFERIVDFKADLDVWGKREVSKKTRLYADRIYAPCIYFNDIAITPANADPPVILNVNEYTPKEQFGFRVGYSFFNLKKFGGSRTIELGYFPNAGFYTILKIGMAFNPKIMTKHRL